VRDGASSKNINRSHTHIQTENNTPDTDTQTHDKNNTANDHTKNHPPHLTTIEGGVAMVCTTFHTRVGGCGGVKKQV